jgi:hypothetical protein
VRAALASPLADRRRVVLVETPAIEVISSSRMRSRSAWVHAFVGGTACVVIALQLDVVCRVLFEDEAEEAYGEEHGLGAVDDNAEKGAAVAQAWA